MSTAIPWSSRLDGAVRARGANLAEALPLVGDGSDRRFFRVPGQPSLVLLHHPGSPGGAVTENDSYFHIGRHLRERGVPVPEIYAYCREEGWMLMEDVGDLSLAECVAGALGAGETAAWYRRVLAVLVHQQLEGMKGFDPAWCFDTPAVTRPFLMERECRYFVWAFLEGYLGLEAAEAELTADFERLLAGVDPQAFPCFLHRDFQSKNLFIKGEKVRVLDFQGARLGPLGYDVAALLIDPYVGLSPALQEDLLGHYQDLLDGRRSFDCQAFREQYDHLALCRNLQVLGAYGFLTRVKGKTQFARYIPQALSGLRRRLAARPGAFPQLAAIVEKITLEEYPPRSGPPG